MKIGYARVSPAWDAVSLQTQRQLLAAAGADRIVAERVSHRSAWKRLNAVVDALSPGDVLICTSISRVAGSSAGFAKLLERVVGRGASLTILAVGGTSITVGESAQDETLYLTAQALGAAELTWLLEKAREKPSHPANVRG